MKKLFSYNVFSKMQHSLLASFLLFIAGHLAAAPLSLPEGPFDGSSVVLKPNFLYVLDNSSSMSLESTNEPLEYDYNGHSKDYAQCKNANKNQGGTLVTKLERVGTKLWITAPGHGRSVNDIIYLAAPGNTGFSGVYKIKSIDTTSTSGYCLAGSDVYNTSVIVHDTTFKHGRPAGWVGSGENRYWDNGCSQVAPKPVNSGNTSSSLNLGGGSDTSCYWYDPKDDAIGTVWQSCTWISGSTSGTNAIEVEVLDSGTSGVFSTAQTLDAYIALRNDNSKCTGEPPQSSSQVNGLYYNPAVNYEPPPHPNKLGNPYPTNLMPSMTSAYTSGWTKVPADGLALLSSSNFATLTPSGALGGSSIGDPVPIAAIQWWPGPAGTNVYSIINQTWQFNREMVYCDTPNRPSGFANDNDWLNSTRCKRNDLTSNTVASSPNYPYRYPARTNGGSLNPSTTLHYGYTVEHQYGDSATWTKNALADLYAFGVTSYTNPHYFRVRPIEYCDSAKLRNCMLVSAGAPTGAFVYPSYVRYCKTGAQASNLTSSPGATECQSLYTGNGGSDYRFARYGLFERIDVKSTTLSGYAVDLATGKTYATRTDCAGVGTSSGCTYAEEMTNMANWFAYYRTRMQLMKSASGHAFYALDGNYRVGFMTINLPEDGNYLPVSDYANTQKRDWLIKLYSTKPDGGTPLRKALSNAGLIFSGKASGVAVTPTYPSLPANDPMQYSCQKNFTLLTTDGYWNGAAGVKIDGTTAIGNQDGGSTPRPKYEGSSAYSDTLADVAKFYFDTDIRDSTYSNCTGDGGADTCSDIKDTQRMITFTLGLGVDGELSYTDDYETAAGGDFNSIKSGTLNWPKPVANKPSAIDDLWHAAVNAGGHYFSAKSPETLKTSLVDAIASVDKAIKSGAPPAVSSMEPVAGDNFAFATSYVSEQWTGNLVARYLSLNVGEFYTPSSAAAWCADNTSALDTTVPACTGNLPTKVSASADARNILINNGSGNLAGFTYANIPGTYKQYFEEAFLGGKLSQWPSLSTAQRATAEKAGIVGFLRGQYGLEDRSTNLPDDQIFRKRDGILGDITDSNPVHVGKPLFDYKDSGYAAFKAGQSGRAKTVYVGANDGMLHAFNADTGEERWAYIPTMLLPKLYRLADKNYASNHANYVNGDPVVGDINSGGWKTILVGGLAQGGRGYFAMDITDPTTPKLLWEFSVNDDSDLGYSYGQPTITKRPDGTWVVLITSGYNNVSPGDGKGYLYVLNAGTGAVLSKISTGVGNTTDPSGLAPASGLASDNMKDNTSKYVYAGDLRGNLWKFDLSTGGVSKFAYLEAGGKAQSITVAPVVYKGDTDPYSLVLVGTGRLLELGDVSNADIQTLYGLKDDNSGVTLSNPRGSSDFVQQTFTTNFSAKTRTVTNNAVDLDVKKGWYIDLGSGERQIVDSMLLAGVLAVPTNVNSGDACSPNGYGWLNYLNFRTGGAYNPVLPSTSAFSSDGIVGTIFLVKTKSDGTKTGEIVPTTKCHTCDSPPRGPEVPLATVGFGEKRLIWRELQD